MKKKRGNRVHVSIYNDTFKIRDKCSDSELASMRLFT